MKIKIISYGHKFYEEEGKPAPYHDFLFSLRDLKNPFWVPELKEFNGTQKEIIEFFEKDPGTQDRVEKTYQLIYNFIEDFTNNKTREDDAMQTYAFKCTGGKHRSVYFAELMKKRLKEASKSFSREIEVELEHIDLHRYLTVNQ